MNSILPTGVSRLNTGSSTFNFDTGSVLIGIDAGRQLTDINNVFIGNNAGSKSTAVSESIFIGNFAGQNIETGKRSIIIGEDKSSTYLNKANIISIGYNNIDNETIGLGSNILSTGSNNILLGKNISCYANNTYISGRQILVKGSDYFIDPLLVKDTSILLNGFNRIGLLNIKSNTNYYSSNQFYIAYEFNHFIKGANTIFSKESDIMFQFKPKLSQSFDFNLGFYKDNSNLVNFNFKNNQIIYTSSQGLNQSIILNNVYVYDTYNTIHIINNDKNYRALSIYINPQYDGYFLDKNKSTNYSQGLIYNINNRNINNIRLDYFLGAGKNNINSNYIFAPAYQSTYSNLASNIDVSILPDYSAFNNSATSLSFKNFIISINDVNSANNFNLVYGKNISVKGNNNICIGDNQTTTGNNSVLIGNSISTNAFFSDCTDSTIIGSSNFVDKFAKNSIVIGNNNFTTSYDELDFYKFLLKRPVIIGSDNNNIDYHLNICDTIVKYKDNNTCNELLLAGLTNTPVAIGFTSANAVPIDSIYKLKHVSNIFVELKTSNWTSNYYIDNRLYSIQKSQEISNIITNIFTENPIVPNDKMYGLYVKHGVYTDALSIYNSSNYNFRFTLSEDLKKNIKYVLPDTLNNISSTNPHFLSYNVYNGEHNMYWNTFQNAFINTDINAKSVVAEEFTGNGAKLYEVNLSDRDTSMLKEGETNLYYTAERVGVIAYASNTKAMNYTLLASNEIIHKINALTTDNIYEGRDNLYYTSNRFDERLLSKTLDNIYNGTSNKYITNDIYTNNLLITGTLTVGKIQILGIDFPNSAHQVSFASQNEVSILKTQVNDLVSLVDNLKNRLVALENT